MLNRTNSFFDTVLAIADDYVARKKAHEEKKPEYDSPEFEAWNETRKEQFSEYPIPAGVCKAYQAFTQSCEDERDEVVMDDFLWDREVEDFLNALRGAGISTFIYTNTSTAVMGNIHDFAAHGCTFKELTTVSKKSWWKDAEDEVVQGIRFEL